MGFASLNRSVLAEGGSKNDVLCSSGLTRAAPAPADGRSLHRPQRGDRLDAKRPAYRSLSRSISDVMLTILASGLSRCASALGADPRPLSRHTDKIVRSVTQRLRSDLSARGWTRMFFLTICGTLFCIGVSFFVDSYSFRDNRWRVGTDPLNDLLIPLLLAPPFFFYLLYKQRELANAHYELLKVSSTDGLTSCLNRQAFTILVEAYLERTARLETRGEAALMVIDVDHFKAVNDRFGHVSGDEALRMISGEIKENVRENDLVGRIGGEEFGVFLPGADRREAGLVAERIRASVNATMFSPQGSHVPLSVSVGATVYNSRSSFKDMFRMADECLYVAKNNGRNRVEFSDANIRSDAPSTVIGQAGFSAV
jgi:diguanylate cyclase